MNLVQLVITFKYKSASCHTTYTLLTFISIIFCKSTLFTFQFNASHHKGLSEKLHHTISFVFYESSEQFHSTVDPTPYNRTLIQLKHYKLGYKKISFKITYFPMNQRGCIKNPVSNLVVVLLLLLLIYSEALWDKQFNVFSVLNKYEKRFGNKIFIENIWTVNNWTSLLRYNNHKIDVIVIKTQKLV